MTLICDNKEKSKSLASPKVVEKDERKGKENVNKEENLISTQDVIDKRKSKTISFDWNELKRAYKQKLDGGCKKKDGDEEGLCDEMNLVKSLKFKTRNIESKEAETELQRSLTKADFARMKIIGQFNKGKKNNNEKV